MPDVKTSNWSLARRLRHRIITIAVLTLVVVSTSVAIHYGSDIPEFQQRTVFGLAQDVAHDLPLDKQGAEMRASVNAQHDLFTRYPDAYEWYVLDGEGKLIGTSETTPVNRDHFPPGLPPAEWDAPSRGGGWEAGKTFYYGDEVRHVIAIAHSDPGGLIIQQAIGEALMHIVLPLVPFTILISIFVSGIIRRTLMPLQSIAEQARRVRTTDDIRPLDPEGAPQEVADLVNALNFSLDKLRNSIEAEKRFLQDAAHALRTPLAIVKARLELDGDKVDRGSLVEEVDGLIRMATQLLASANAERLVVKADTRADLTTLAQDVVSNMTPLAIRAGVDLGYDDDGRKAVVRGDVDAISHALKNLIENALKYTPRGRTVTVQVAHDPPSITVHDEGPGIPEGHDEQIFSRHSRGKFGDGKGAGLGLSIVRRIMVAHDGEAMVVRSGQPGAAFRLIFPAPARQAPRSANDDAPAAPPQGGKLPAYPPAA